MSTKEGLSSKQSKSPAAENSLPSSVAFVHNFLDEYGLDPYEFRLYAHIVRRTGGKPEGVCFASLRKTAEICKMSTRKAQQGIKVLIKANFVTQTKRTGRTDEYRVTPVSDWVPKEELDEIRKAIAGNSTKTSVGSEIEAETETIES
ncbi:helix-turn-helix domain-containing protein [Nostoc sp.]|uniref:helix-turn-helix domain-containing protein n=1 Tax=Nostoc sp. TaxID=1180 RepID=UPI002FF6CE4F